MAKILNVNTANDYAEYVGAKVLHPHVSVIHYDVLEGVHHSLNNYDVYGLFMQKEFPFNLNYGMGSYQSSEGSLIAVAPGQIGGVSDNGEIIKLHGWVLMFDQDFVRGTDLEKLIADCHFFSYNNNEALMLSSTEKRILSNTMKLIRMELTENAGDSQLDNIVRAYIQLVLEYCQRFYNRQFKQEATGSNDLLARFKTVLDRYYEKQMQYKNGTPSVKYCASELFLSPNYFGDVVKGATGMTATHYIRHYVIDRAKNLLVSGKQITETAFDLGFDYSQHFTRVFKQETGMTPSQYVVSIKHTDIR